ncbi:inhibitor of carbonic anhydrase-like isoform X1 [Pipistrellus kuhlii]|uniref:inhibitor of carbonic anhydrase-like isoform X1 n=2 Tax=Pipistrellus kuhlii TaxID=59472 RepID=UPI001E2724F5|nr:inhibitor of carbonic anhydrase-like isoform X1 [Pipistrellus kuhlii]
MRLTICTLLCAGALGLCLADSDKMVRWCTVSGHEFEKCLLFSGSRREFLPEAPIVSCVNKTSHHECIQAIAANLADAVTLDAGLLFEAGQAPFNLKPVVAEYYGSEDNPQTSYYAVAVVKKGSGFQLNQLQGKKSCHTGIYRSAGWHIPMSTLYPELSEPQKSLQKAAANFFAGSCVPGADGTAFPKLCQLCAGKGKDKCAFSQREPYYGYSGAFKCLQDGEGEVGFMRHTTVSENLARQADRDQYELLCRDNTRKPVDQYEECHLASIPSHAVVARSVGGNEDLIWELLNRAQEYFGKNTSADFKLFGSPHRKDLLFTDAARGFLKVPPKMDAMLYLGYEYLSAIRSLRGAVLGEDSQKVKWCAVGPHESAKCNEWAFKSGGILKCTTKPITEDCITAIVKGDADAMSLNGGFIYTAGKCGLVPVLAENYMSEDGKEQLGSKCENTLMQGHYAVAVVKKSDADLTWNSLRGKKSCHPEVGTSAGWDIPMGLIYNQTGSCKFDEFFSQSCAPGSDPKSSLCALCGSDSNAAYKCAPRIYEKYYGSSGALRCLVEKGDVAFVEHPTVLQITHGKNPEDWAKDLKQKDFELLCLDGTRKPVTEAQNCHLGIVPNHAVVSRKEKADFVRRMLYNQQELFGRNGFEYMMFQMFKSSTKDLLFSDDTECLANLQDKTTYQKYLGPEYLTTVANVRQCLPSENKNRIVLSKYRQYLKVFLSCCAPQNLSTPAPFLEVKK